MARGPPAPHAEAWFPPSALPRDLGRQLLPITGVPSDGWLYAYLVTTSTWLPGLGRGDRGSGKEAFGEELSAETLVPGGWGPEEGERGPRGRLSPGF